MLKLAPYFLIVLSFLLASPTYANGFLDAAHTHDIETLKSLVNGTNINTRDKNGKTALILASSSISNALNGSKGDGLQAIQFLLDKGADIHAKDNDGRTALMFACHQGHSKAVQLFLDKGADIHARDNNGQTSLMFASNYQFSFFNDSNGIRTSTLLLNNGADIHAYDNNGKTVLNFASSAGIAQLLLDNGANIHAKINDPWMALVYSIRYAPKETIELLFDIVRTFTIRLITSPLFDSSWIGNIKGLWLYHA